MAAPRRSSARRFTGWAASARPGRRSNMPGLIARTIRRCCSLRPIPLRSCGATWRASPEPLLLPESAAAEEEVRLNAVLSWLAVNPGWLLILDNVDTPNALPEVNRLTGRLTDGHVPLTGPARPFCTAGRGARARCAKPGRRCGLSARGDRGAPAE